MILRVLAVSMIGFTLAGCVSSSGLSGDVYSASEAKQVQSVTYGTIVSGTAADGVSKEPAQYRTANGPDGIAIVAALDLYGARMHDSTVSHALHLFGFRCGINVAGQAAAAHAREQQRPVRRRLFRI